MRHYQSFADYCRRRFGMPVAKVPIRGGFSCPNRDGTLSFSGCAFCDNEAFSPVAHSLLSPIEQVHGALRNASTRFKSFIVYAQPFSNTYGSLDQLRATYEPLITIPGVVGLSIGTRPDCISDEALAYLADLAKRTWLSIELGVQSSHDATLRAMNRGHDFGAFSAMVNRLWNKGIEIVAHVILGLPGESVAMMFETADRLAALPLHGVKFHQLMVIKGTAIERMHKEGAAPTLSREEYAPIVCGCIERLRSDQIVHRIMADTRMEHGLIAPAWSADKQGSIRFLHAYMDTHGITQGRLCKARSSHCAP